MMRRTGRGRGCWNGEDFVGHVVFFFNLVTVYGERSFVFLCLFWIGGDTKMLASGDISRYKY